MVSGEALKKLQEQVMAYPTVHYSNVFKSKDDAKEFAEYQKANPDDVFPMCMGCHYNVFKEG